MTTILIYPYADKCRNKCKYCFEDEEFRKDNDVFCQYDKQKMSKTLAILVEECKIKNENFDIILHGGEVFDLPAEDLEFFMGEIKKYKDKVSIQSSLGVPLSSEHLRLLKIYNAVIGVSVDGPREYNILRGPREKTLNNKFQETVYSNISKLQESGIHRGCITILSKVNATPEKIEKLIEWSVKNTNGGRFNQMFVPWHSRSSDISEYALNSQELTIAFNKLMDETLINKSFNFALFNEIKSALLGDFHTVCTFNRCDYLQTACKTILPDGNIARCDRCFQDGYYYTSNRSSSARWKALEHTECKGCKYFAICAGGCPGEGKNQDWRSKMVHCEAYYSMFQRIETLLRKTFPGIFLSIDLYNYWEDFVIPRKRFNPFARDSYLIDTKERMINSFKLVGWTPNREEEQKIKQENQQPQQLQNKNGYVHSDHSNSGTNQKENDKCSCR